MFGIQAPVGMIGLCVLVVSLCVTEVHTLFCGENEARCMDGSCIPLSKVKDGVSDCPRGKYDEVGPICEPTELHCANGTCMPRNKFQDGVSDCLDNSDEVILIGDRCTGDELSCCTCQIYVNNSVCWDGSCKCQNGFYSNEHGTRCTLRVVEDQCDNDTDCSVAVTNSYCTLAGVCGCHIGYIATEDNTICQKRRINETCLNDVDCSTLIDHSLCRHERCVCISGHFPIADNHQCQLRLLGDTCEERSDCAIKNSQCENRQCACVSGFKSNNNRTACISLVIGDPCLNDSDCVNAVLNSRCLNDTCMCLPWFKDGGDRLSCVLRHIDDTCASNNDCYLAVLNSECVNNVCVCESGHQVDIHKNECTRRKIGDATCITDIDCSDAINNSFCEHGKCSCSNAYYANSDMTQCIRRRITDSCRSDADCTEAVLHSECFFRKCRCLSGYYRAEEDTACIRRKLGDNCTRDYECTQVIEQSQCLDRTCQCRAGFGTSGNDTTCTKRGLGSPCSADSDCKDVINNTRCYSGICACAAGYKLIRGTDCKLRPSRIGHPCLYNTDCYLVVDDSKCKLHRHKYNGKKIGECVCNARRFSDREGKECTVLPKELGDRCGLDEHCTKVDPRAACTTSFICSCDESSVYSDKDGFCILPKKLGEPCERTEHCLEIDPLAVCYQDKRCHCDETSVPNDKRTSCLRMSEVPTCMGSQNNNCKEVKPYISDLVLGSICNINDTDPCPVTNATDQWCAPELGRTNTRCRCKSGFGQKYNEADCHEVQTYYIRINITEENICFARKDQQSYCPDFHPFNYIKQYSNTRTGHFRYMKLRISVLGLDYVLNMTIGVGDRYVSSEILNMTGIEHGLQVQAVINVQEDIYDVIPPRAIALSFLGELNESMGVLGRSRLKIGFPLEDNVFISDFNECEDQGGDYNDCDLRIKCIHNNGSYECAPRAWCINTNGSYMCSCKYEFDDNSLKRDSRPGRICDDHFEKPPPDFTCSDDSCKAKMEWIVLALVGFGIILLSLIAYEIISKKREMEKRDAHNSGLKRGPSRKRRRIKKIRVKEKKLRPREHRVLLPGDQLLSEINDIDSPFANQPFLQDALFEDSHEKIHIYE